MTTLQSQLLKSLLIIFYISLMVACLAMAAFAFPTAKIASVAFLCVGFGMYGIAGIVGKNWNNWFIKKETS